MKIIPLEGWNAPGNQDSFREPMLVHVPFPPWALRGAEAVDDVPAARWDGELDSL